MARHIGLEPSLQEKQDLKNESDAKNSVLQRLQNLEYSIDMINKSLNQQYGIHVSQDKALEIEMQNMSEKIRDTISDFSKKLDAFENKIKNYNAVLFAFEKMSETFVVQDVFLKSFMELKKQIEDLSISFQRSRTDVNDLVLKNHAQMNLKFESFKNEINSRPSEIPQFSKQFDEKVELIALNGTNAILRTTNTEKHVQILEKKIEQIFLLLKQHDLNRQAS